MLACTRIGAVHSVVFAGFSSESLRDRIIDASRCVGVGLGDPPLPSPLDMQQHTGPFICQGADAL